MNDRPDSENRNDAAQQAAAWVLRVDRGLTAIEQDEFSAWLARDPRHGEQLARHRAHWKRLDRLAEWRPEHGVQPNPDLLAPPLRSRLRHWLPVAAGIAAAIVGAIFVFRSEGKNSSRPSASIPVVAEAAPTTRSRVLDDGSVVALNHDAELVVQFSPNERRVRLDQGEAHFAVTKDASRPFIVNAGGIDVWAVGTAFNVRVNSAAVEVLVTEGRVQIDTAPTASVPAESTDVTRPAIGRPMFDSPVLEARQRAVVSRMAKVTAPQIATLTAGEIERVLAWQHRLLDFTAAPLADIVVEFNRRNVVQLVATDPGLASIRISASFRSDNFDGFVRLLEAGFGVQVERRGDAEIVLRKSGERAAP